MLFKEYNRLLIFFKKLIFFITYNNRKFKSEGNIIRDIRNHFRLKNEELNYTAIKDIIFLDKKKETKVIQVRILRDFNNFFQHEEKQENCYKPVRVSNIWSNNYIEYESNGNKNKTLSVEEYLNKISPYLKDILNNLKKSGT